MASTIKVNNIQNQCGANIANKCGTTITLGASGDTITLACGASQTGFGRTGTVDWQTGDIKTATFTAANGEGYFANTSGGAFTMNLPAGTAGNIVSVVDYTNSFQTNNLTIAANGSQKIGGIAAPIALSTEGQSVTFVYVDDTEGWKNVQDSTSNVTGNPNLIASGGTVTTCGNYKIHTFTGPGTFCVSSVSQTAADNIVSYLVVAAGGGSPGVQIGGNAVGGSGAGGFREYKGPADCYTASPLNGNPGGTAVTVTAQGYPITVGAAGAAGPASSPYRGGPGSNSIFSTIVSTGGGAAGHDDQRLGDTGGSGGGAGGGTCSSGCRASGNTPPVSPPQGNPGGSSPNGPPDTGSGGGGGATAAGSDSSGAAGNGGAGATTSISASPTAYAGGGGGGAGNPQNTAGTGGTGGGGAGGTQNQSGTAGTANTGGGAGGGGLQDNNAGQAGGSGIVIIRYKFQ